MKVLIIEDDSIQNNNLKNLINENYPDIDVFQSYFLKEAMQIIKESEIDLFLIDINLPDGSGIEFSKKIRSIPEHNLTGIVIITTNSHNILQTFKEIHCYDFLVKPYNREDIKKIIETFRESSVSEESKDDKYLIIPLDNKIGFKVYHKDIIFAEYVSRECIIHTTQKIIKCKSLTLSKILDEVDSGSIVQSHKSYIVNVNHISEISKEYQRMWNIYFYKTEVVAKLSVKYKNGIFKRWGVN